MVAATEAIQHGQLAASVVVGSSFALGFLWLAYAFSIAKAVDHCLALKVVGVSVWLDAECHDSIKFVTPVAIVLLILMDVATHREVKDKADADAKICDVV